MAGGEQRRTTPGGTGPGRRHQRPPLGLWGHGKNDPPKQGVAPCGRSNGRARVRHHVGAPVPDRKTPIGCSLRRERHWLGRRPRNALGATYTTPPAGPGISEKPTRAPLLSQHRQQRASDTDPFLPANPGRIASAVAASRPARAVPPPRLRAAPGEPLTARGCPTPTMPVTNCRECR